MKRFCVVVPAHNEALVIEKTLRALIAAGATPGDIYLVDDCSSDNTGDIAFSLGVTVLRNNPNLGKARAVSRIVEVYDLYNQYEFIGLMDADTIVDPNYFTEMLKGFEDKEVVVTCGRPISVAHNWLTAHRALCYANGHYVYRKAQTKIGVVCIAPGCSTMYRSSIFSKLNWHAGTVAEDMYVTIQIHHEKLGKVAYMGNARVYTQTPRTLSAYSKQMYRWYTGTWEVVRELKVFTGNTKVDWECKLLWTEGMITAVFRLGLPFVLFALPLLFPGLPWYSGIAGIALLLLSAYVMSLPSVFIFAWLERRSDIIRYSPLFVLMGYIDVYLVLKGFWRAIVQRKSIAWFTPPRYLEKKG